METPTDRTVLSAVEYSLNTPEIAETKGSPMAIKPLHLARHITGLSAALMLALLAGCASEPEVVAKPAPEPVVQPEPAPIVVVRPDYPQSYTVVKGDTLWDISARFLRDPWMWPEVWQVNPQVNNPHLIYPGDVLTLYFIDGKPVMRVERGGGPSPLPEGASQAGFPVVKYKAEVREMPLDAAVPTIPLEEIRQFLSRPRVVTEDELEEMPYVLAYNDKRLMGGGGNIFYARGIKQEQQYPEYVLLRAGDEYVDPETDEVLGYEAVYLGDAKMLKFGDPATFEISMANREILRGDRLAPRTADNLPFRFMPRAPKKQIKGQIISVMDGVASVGQFQKVVLNLGRQEDVEPGHVLAIMQAGEEAEDVVTGDDVQLPDVRAGTLMIFRVFERVSYGVVMSATKPIHIYDTVTNP